MKKHLLIGVVGLSSLFAGGQNLVPNGSFEQFSTCPIGLAKINYALNWYNPAIGVNVGGNGGTPDYFNQCATPSQAGIPNNAFGYQQAYSGNAYGGLALFYFGVPDFREYIESDIVMPLLANGCYHFEMYVNLANTSKFSTEEISVYFSDTLISGINNYDPLPFMPQINNIISIPDTLNWTLISGQYVAHGGENYLIIGNFKNDSNTNITVVDTLNQYSSGYIYIDAISLTLEACTGLEEHNKNTLAILFPNPFSKELTIQTHNNLPYFVILYDIASRKIMEKDFINIVTLNTEKLSKGIYIYEVRDNPDGSGGVLKKGKVVKD